ncbi:hypothetical protein EDC01DRAFT_37222 [Geopyxis carbonaria]|nr:hypothetical protein EDC01DRAFT_37222 [Geopyxis carbonaria]
MLALSCAKFLMSLFCSRETFAELQTPSFTSLNGRKYEIDRENHGSDSLFSWSDRQLCCTYGNYRRTTTETQQAGRGVSTQHTSTGSLILSSPLYILVPSPPSTYPRSANLRTSPHVVTVSHGFGYSSCRTSVTNNQILQSERYQPVILFEGYQSLHLIQASQSFTESRRFKPFQASLPHAPPTIWRQLCPKVSGLKTHLPLQPVTRHSAVYHSFRHP